MLRDCCGAGYPERADLLQPQTQCPDLCRSLVRHGWWALHGDMDQYKRMEWLEKFRSGEITMLVCSDVAARGWTSRPSAMPNYDVPITAEDYIHRIGCTGRAGRRGKSITLATRADPGRWPRSKS